jgi:hypothetical protein
MRSELDAAPRAQIFSHHNQVDLAEGQKFSWWLPVQCSMHPRAALLCASQGAIGTRVLPEERVCLPCCVTIYASFGRDNGIYS